MELLAAVAGWAFGFAQGCFLFALLRSTKARDECAGIVREPSSVKPPPPPSSIFPHP